MNKELIYVIGQMATEKGIDKEILFEALESALLSASKKTMGVADNVRMELDRHTGVLKVFARKKVVETVADAKLEITLSQARKLNAEAELEDEIEIEHGSELEIDHAIHHDVARDQRRKSVDQCGHHDAAIFDFEKISRR